MSDFYDYLDHLSDDAKLNSIYMENWQKLDPSLYSPAVMSGRTLPPYIPSTHREVVPDLIWDSYNANNTPKPDALDIIYYALHDPSKLTNDQKKMLRDQFSLKNTNKPIQKTELKQNAGNANTNVPTKGGIFAYKDIVDSANAVKNFINTQHEIYKQKNAKKESDNSANTNVNIADSLAIWNSITNKLQQKDIAKQNANNIPIMIAASGSVNPSDTSANVGNEGPQTPNNANNPPTGTNAGTKGTDKKGTGADTKDTGNAIGNSVKEKANQDSNKGAGTTNVGTDTNTVKTPKTAEQIAYDRARLAADLAADTERSAIIQDYYNKYGINKQVPKAPNTPQVTKTALSDPQRDYYRYLTGYHRMSPNQAILSMGLDPTKYTF